MGSSLRGRTNIFWLATLHLLLSLYSTNKNDWLGQCVDAAIQDGYFSISSQYRNRGFGLSNRSSRRKQKQYKRQRPQLPWLLPYNSISAKKDNDIRLSEIDDPTSRDCCDTIIPWKIATASLIKLRGGSNKSEVGSKSRTSADKDKRRSDKQKKSNNSNKRKDKRKQKRNSKSKNADDGDDDNDDMIDDDDDDELPDDSSEGTEKDSVATTDSTTKEKSSSKLFLVDPFRMNEIARYEASIADKPEAHVDVAAEETAETSFDVGSGDEDIDSNNTKTKQRNKKNKKVDPIKSPTKKLVNESSVVAEESESFPDKEDKLQKGKQKKREHRQKGKRNRSNEGAEETKNGAETTNDDEEMNVSTGDNAIEASEGDGDTDAADTTEESNSFWWVDVWTQQLSDPEDMEEGDETEDTSTDIDILPNGTLADGNEMKPNDNDSVIKGSKKEGNFLSLPIEENMESATKEDGNATSTIDSNSPAMVDENDTNATKLSINETTALAVDHNISSTTLESLEAPISYVSTGAWILIDNMITIGLASKFSSLRLSRKLRLIRKLSARITRLHGFLSGKPSSSLSLSLLSPEFDNETATNITANTEIVTTADGEESIEVIQKRIAAIDKAREGVERAQAEERAIRAKRSFWGFRSKEDIADLPLDSNETKADEDSAPTIEAEEVKEPKIPQKSLEEIEAEFQRMERVREIDRLVVEGQNRLADLICEKDVLQRRPNPLFNYTTKETIITVEQENKDDKGNSTQKIEIQASRTMNFPPDDLVAEYLDMMISTRRLTKMNHTDLWKESEDDSYEGGEESIGDDLFTASANAHRLYQASSSLKKNGDGNSKNGKKSGGGGSWLLRQSIGGRKSLGEKVGELVETLAYKAVTASLMSFLSRLISGLHGTNVLKHSDIRLVLEQSPDLPPVPKDGIIRGDHQNYAEETIKTVMRRKSRRSKKRSSKAAFVQQEAVTETLLSHVQISAPLLKLFPLAWQRALLGNIIALSCAIISDFLDGLHFQILGHQLSFAFRPITEVDMARHFQMAGGPFNHRRYKAAEFEAAVQATSEDLKEELNFLDSWHERALGSGVLRTQIANMIARIVLTLTDEILSGAQMDLWSLQAGGPRMLAGLEHRIEEEDVDEQQL